MTTFIRYVRLAHVLYSSVKMLALGSGVEWTEDVCVCVCVKE